MGGDRSQGGRSPHAPHIDVLRSLAEVPGTAANGTIVSAGPAVWAVERVVPASDYTLRLEFRDGRRGVFDFRPCLDFGPYAPLRDVELLFPGIRADAPLKRGADRIAADPGAGPI